jgi:D-sedoheptulose 7-phosphate isomerase
MDYIINKLLSHIETVEKADASNDLLSSVKAAADAITASLRNKGKVMLAGNGGSAADSQHIAAEFINRFNFDREGLYAVALTTDTSVLTSIGNDSAFDKIFSRQICAVGNERDVFVALSTSGGSANIIEALRECRRRNIKTIGFTGLSGGAMKDCCDILISVPSSETPHIQETHILLAHIICGMVEEAMFPDNNAVEQWK